MSKLWKTNWFRPVFFIALALGIIAVAFVLALPEKELDADIADNSLMQTPDNTAIASLHKDELVELDESGVDGEGIIETESVLDEDYNKPDEEDEGFAEDEDVSGLKEPEENTADSDGNDNSDNTNSTANQDGNESSGNTSDTEENTAVSDVKDNSSDTSDTEENTANSDNQNNSDTSDTEGSTADSNDNGSSDGEESEEDPDAVATYKDPDHEEEDPPQTVGAKWVNGEAVPMTNAEVNEFLRQIYATQTQEEYRALMDSVVYFNVGIDSTRLIWHEHYAG